MTRKALALFALMCACLAVPPPDAQAATTREIIQDCAFDGVLQGTYTASELRRARAALEGDVKEYTDCDVVLRRAELALRAATSQPGTRAPSAPATRSDDPRIGTPANEPSGYDQATNYDKDRLQAAADSGDQPVTVGDVTLVPASGISTDASKLPPPLTVALTILLASALVGTLPVTRQWIGRLLRRR